MSVFEPSTFINPGKAFRPLKIIHGLDRYLGEDGHTLGLTDSDPAGQWNTWVTEHSADISGEQLIGVRTYLQSLADLGVGGIVTNVAFNDYMLSEDNWKALTDEIKACAKKNMVVWLYDEDGYPSGAAGNLVLKENSEYEAQAMVYDPSRQEPFYVRPAYEYTHASNNHYAARRYVNIIDDRAVAAFIRHTHDE